MNWFLGCYEKYAIFDGRACREEYWMFQLCYIVTAVILSVIDTLVGAMGILPSLFAFGSFIPAMAVFVRRLHDINRSGWWGLIAIIPLIGLIVTLVFTVLKGTEGVNNYGDDPLIR